VSAKAAKPPRDAQAEAMQSIIDEVMEGKAPWMRNGARSSLVTIGFTSGEAARVALLVAQIAEPANATLAKALASGIDRMAARAAAEKISAAVEAAAPPTPSLVERPIQPSNPFPWGHIPIGTRVAIIERLKTLPLPWPHKTLAVDFQIPKQQMTSLILGVVLFGFDNPYLIGTRSIDELWDAANKRWLHATALADTARSGARA
jgi:hypothetical protein